MKTTLPDNEYFFLKGGGEMGELTRTYDWSQTVLGTPDTWPPSLRTTVSNLLHSRFPMLLWWGPELIQFYNDAYRFSLGIDGKHPTALGQRGADCWPEIWPTIKPLIDQVQIEEQATWSEDQLIPIYRNGRLEDVYWTFSYSPVYDESGHASGVLVTCYETTDKVQTVQRLQLSEQRFQNLVREATIGIIVLDGADMQVSIVNDTYAHLIDRSPQTLIGHPLFSIIPEAEAVFRPILDQVRLTGESLYLYEQPYFVNVEETRKEGFLNLVYQPYKELDGRVTGVMVLCQDVTAQVTAQRRLAASEARLRSLIESAPFPIGVYTGLQMTIEFANQSILDVWGKGNQVLGKPYATVLPELANQGIFEQLHQVYTTGVAFHAQNQRVDIVVDGKLQPYYFKYSFTPLFDAEDHVYGVMNTAAEVTDLVVTQQQLEDTQALLQGAIDLAELAMWRMDITTGVFTYSQRFMEWLGFSEQTQSLDAAYDPLPAEYRQSVADAIEAVIQPDSSGIYQNEHPIINRLTGQQRIIHAQAKVYRDAQGRPDRLVGTAQDVTLQRQLQRALEAQVNERTRELADANEELAAANEELAASNEEYATINEELTESTELLIRSNDNLQQFAYVASHDLQEPLRKIQQFSDVLKTNYADQLGSGVDYLNRMQQSALRMSSLIRDLLTFSRISRQQEAFREVDLTKLVEEVITDLDLLIQETGALVSVKPLPKMLGDTSQLSMLFHNLLTNALKFRRSQITPEITLSGQLIAAGQIPESIHPARLAEVYYRIDVADNGIGFDEKYLDRIFQVFQRLHSKKDFAGTGIGLAICEKVVANHGGVITASSRPDQGATFIIYFPI